MSKTVTLLRDCHALVIPSGETFVLPAGTPVVVTQSLGGSYTVQAPTYGALLRIADRDADALGLSPAGPATSAPAKTVSPSGPVTEDAVWDQLRSCYDPEIPVNIVDLGLVYGCEVEPRSEGGEKVHVRFTLTAPGCGMGDVLKQDMERKLLSVRGVGEAFVEVVLDPPWSQEMMSDAARLQLGLM